MHIHPVAGAQGSEVVNRVDRDHEFIQGQVGVVLEAKVVYFPIFAIFKDGLLAGKVIPILADIPNLELAIRDVGFELFEGFLFGIGDMIDVGGNL